MISLLNWNDKKLELDMGMGQRDFAKARLLPFLEEEGLVVSLEKGTCSEASWKFTELVQQEDTIKVVGEVFEGGAFEGKSLFELLPLGENPNQTDIETRINLLKSVFRAMEVVLEGKPDFQFVGPLQIILSSATNPEKILFLPPTLLQRAIESQSQKDQALLMGYFQNPLLQAKKDGTEALAFSQSVYLYLSLSKQLPFPEVKEEGRILDYRDRNFLPLNLLVPGLEEKIALSINTNLALGSIDTTRGKVSIQERIRDRGKTEAIEPVLLGRVLAEVSGNPLVRKASLEEVNELEQQRKSYQVQQEKKLNRRRFIRKNSTLIKIGAVALGIVLIALGISLKDRQGDFVATGLNPTQVCQVLYTALSEQNLVMAQAMCQGRGTEDFQEKLSNFFVSNRMRTGMNPTSLAMTPYQWLLYVQQEASNKASNQANFQPQRDVWIYGLTNFNLHIENQQVSQLPLYPPQRRDKTRPVGDVSKTPVEAVATYTIVFNDSLSSFQIQNYQDHLVLEYIKDRWQVVSIKQAVQIESVEIAQVEGAFSQLLLESGGDLTTATEKLAQQYPWIQ